MITTTYKFRLYPTKDQQEQLWKWSRALNDLYNHFLSLQRQQVAKRLPVLRRFDTHNLIPKLKHEIEHLNDVYSDARQACSDRVATCMILWQRGHIKFPKFRSGYQFFNVTYPDFNKSCKLTGSYFTGGKLTPIKVKIHREIQGTIKTASIHCDERGKWWVLLTAVQDITRLQKFNMDRTVGIDLGCNNLLATSDGYTIQSPKFLKRISNAISEIQTRIDTYHKPTGSKKDGTYHMSRKCIHLKKTIRRLYGKRNRLMKNFLHTRSRRIVDHYDVVVVENLRVKEMKEQSKQQGSPSAKSVNRVLSQNAVSMFKDMLHYKSKKYIEVNPAYTSKTCATCGQVCDTLTLADRTYRCTSCGSEMDRDINAAINIRNLGILQILHLVGDTRVTITGVRDQLQMCNSLYPCQAIA